MEILLIVAIVLAIFMLPRMLSRQHKDDIQRPDPGPGLSGWKRMAILASFLWPALMALYLKPWDSGWHIFFYVAVCPVLLAWGISWVFSGFRKQEK